MPKTKHTEFLFCPIIYVKVPKLTYNISAMKGNISNVLLLNTKLYSVFPPLVLILFVLFSLRLGPQVE